MRIEGWQKNQKVERTSPGSKNKYKVTYWDGQEKWTSDLPGDGRGGRREKRLQERKQSRPSIKEDKEKLDAAVKRYVEGEKGWSAGDIVDAIIVHLGREVARETIRSWVKGRNDEGKAKEAIEAINKSCTDKLRDKKAFIESAKKIAMRILANNNKGWIDKHGKFYLLRGNETHEDFARKQLNWTKEGFASEVLYWQGWFCIVPYGSDTLMAQSSVGKTVNEVQLRELTEMAILLGFGKVMQDNGNSFRVIWMDEKEMIASRVERIANKVVNGCIKNWRRI